MPLPHNVTEERRKDDGARHLHDQLKNVFDEIKREIRSQIDELRDEFVGKLDGHVSYKALLAALITIGLGLFGGAMAITSATRAQVDAAKSATDSRIEKVDTALQSFKAETGAEVKGMYRFLLEKQNPAIVRQQVEQQKRDEAPPPEPLNPLAPARKARR